MLKKIEVIEARKSEGKCTSLYDLFLFQDLAQKNTWELRFNEFNNGSEGSKPSIYYSIITS